MVILKGSYAIFWKNRADRMQFHADGWKYHADESAAKAVERFRAAFPDDVVCSVRDQSGRFVSFKGEC